MNMNKALLAAAGAFVLAVVGGVYFWSQPTCDSDGVQKALFSILDEKVLFLEKNGLSDEDVTKRLEVITRTSSNDDAKSCSANLSLSFTKPIADNLAALASSKKRPDLSKPNFALQLYLPLIWNVPKARIEMTIAYRYTKLESTEFQPVSQP
jgi:hypothetical protein